MAVKNSLRIKTFKMLTNPKQTVKLATIAAETGLSLDWLRSFAKQGDEIKSSSDNIQTLYEFFTGVDVGNL